jgi:hypothetical protein
MMIPALAGNVAVAETATALHFTPKMSLIPI